MITKNSAEDWQKFEGSKIPSSLKLQPVIFNYLKKEDRILDIGCGAGKTLFELYRMGYRQLTGVDVNQKGIDLANQIARESNLAIFFERANAVSLPFEDKSFNFVITQALWTTIIDPEERVRIIKEIGRVVRENGLIYVAAFGQTWEHPHYREVYSLGLAKKYEKGTFDAVDHKTGEFKYLAHHYTKKELKDLLKEGGFGNCQHYRQTIFKTQSGNYINGHVILSMKG